MSDPGILPDLLTKCVDLAHQMHKVFVLAHNEANRSGMKMERATFYVFNDLHRSVIRARDEVRFMTTGAPAPHSVVDPGGTATFELERDKGT